LLQAADYIEQLRLGPQADHFQRHRAAMISATVRAEMRRLVLGEHWRIGTVARRFGVHHSVVRRAVYEVAEPRPLPAVSAVDPFKPYLVERLEKYPELTATRLFAELRERGFEHGIAVLRRYIAHLRGPRLRKAYLRVEVEPAEQAQVDWGSFGHMRIGATQRPLSVFVMVLSWSRALFLDFSLDQRMETFCRMHQRAFGFFGGVPRKVLYDNLKSVVLHHIGSTVQFNPTFLAFAGHYLFEPTAAPVRYPEAKGRAEAIIKYIRHAFFYGRSFTSIEDLRVQAAAWRDDVANQRLHATTRERPADRLRIERTRLRPLPNHPADTDSIVAVIVSKEARVRLDTNSYSVPHRFVGRSVILRASDATVRVLCDDNVVAEHPRCWDRRRAIEHPDHIKAMLDRRPGARGPKRRDRLASLSPQCRLISDNYFCRPTTITFAGQRRPDGACEAACPRVPDRCWGSRSPDGHGRAGQAAEAEDHGKEEAACGSGRSRDECSKREDVAARCVA
jgi:transposase